MIVIHYDAVSKDVPEFGDKLKELLETALGVSVSKSGDRITIEEDVSKRKVKFYIKKALHALELYELFRPLATKDGFEVRGRPTPEVSEE